MDDNSASGDDDRGDDRGHGPWPYLNKLFKFKMYQENSVVFNCLPCRPKVKEVYAYKNSPSNLKKHLEVRITTVWCFAVL